MQEVGAFLPELRKARLDLEDFLLMTQKPFATQSESLTIYQNPSEPPLGPSAALLDFAFGRHREASPSPALRRVPSSEVRRAQRDGSQRGCRIM